ncbi:MAG: VCBS repeat-containing protein, partial [Planctomycetaceae bacterium]|nr:VCBS repeat-containing protein [Planctomycetaceae bacterium]
TSDVANDTVTLTTSTGTVINNGDGTWSWTFNTNDGPDQSQTVIITATDSDGAATSTSFSLIVNNIAPTVSVANAAVSVSEGETALNTGSFGDAGLDVVELTATIGTVTSNGDGTWSWSFDTNDGPDQSQIVTITATDSDGAISTTTFTLTIKNVAPMSSLIGFYNGNWWISTADERGVYAIHVAASGPASTIKKVLTGDFNGDGLDDLAAWVTNGDWLVGLSDGKGLFTFSTWTSWTVSGIKEVHVGDFNNDGKDDIIGLFPIPGGNRGRWWVGQSNGTQFQNRNWGDFGNFTGILDVAVGNFDGMKGDDLAIITVTGNIFMAKTSNTRFQYMFSHNWNVNYGFNYFQTGDFNGDGRDDVVAVFGNEANRSIFVAKSTGPGTGFASMKYAGLTALHTFDSLSVGDFNGDGKDDVAARLNTTKWWLGLAGVNEFNFTFGTTWSFATNGVNDIHVGSTNGDGNSDILGRDNNGNWYSAESNSTSLTNRLVDMWAPVNWQFVNGGNFQPQTTSEMAVFPSAPLKLEAEEASTPELTDRWSGATESTSIAGPATTESATPLKPADKEEERIEDYASFGEGSLLDLLYS